MYKLFCLVLSILVEISVVHTTLQGQELGSVLQELAETLHAICIDRSGTDDATINKIINGEFVNDPKIKSYMKCLLLQSTAMNYLGELNTDIMIEMLPPNLKDIGTKGIKKCATHVADISNLDEKAFAFIECMYHHNPDTFAFF